MANKNEETAVNTTRAEDEVVQTPAASDASAEQTATEQTTPDASTEATTETPAFPEADTAAAQAANTRSYADLITNQYDAYIQGKQNQIDYQTQQAVNNTQRQYDDAVSGYQKQYRDLTTSMYQNIDNNALMARANGQRGGMGTLSVNTAQADYQAQRQALATKQQQLATDTARQIEELRANGEFEKADALLEARQLEFQQLYADAVRVDENQYANEQYETAIEREDAAIDLEQQTNERNYRRELGMAFLSAGVVPPADILADMGIDAATAQTIASRIALGY